MSMTTLHQELIRNNFHLHTHTTYRIFSFVYPKNKPAIIFDKKLPNSEYFVSDLIHLPEKSIHLFGYLSLEAEDIYAPLYLFGVSS